MLGVQRINKNMVPERHKGSYPASYLTDPDDKVVPVYLRNKLEVVVVGGDGPPMMQAWRMGYGTTVSVDKWR